MRLPRVRFTVRRMIVAMAMTGVGLGWPLARRSASLHREAARHAGDGAQVSLEEMYNPATEAGKVRSVDFAGDAGGDAVNFAIGLTMEF